MLELKNTTKIYKSKQGTNTIAIDNVSIKFPNLGLIFVLGTSGSGKSTLLNMLGLLDTPTKGSVYINGKDTCKLKETELTNYRNNYIGFIFQEHNLLEELNVYENISLIMNRKDDREVIDKYLNLVGLNNYGKRKISELSGGEKQRVAIARALLNNPSIILADEPTGNLDSKNSEIIFEYLKEISKQKLVIVVTHDEEYANKYSDAIIRIKDGKIIENNLLQVNNEYKKLTLKKNHLRSKNKMKLAFSLLKTKKIRLLVTSILISITFAIVGFTISTKNFDIAKMHAEALIEEDKPIVTIKKDIRGLAGTLSNKDLDEILPKLSWNYQKNQISIVVEIHINLRLPQILMT